MKRFLVTIVALIVSLGLASPLLAQEGTPEAAPPFVTAPGLGVSEFDIVITDEAYDAPSTIPAGRYLVNVTNTTAEPAAAAFMMPDGEWVLDDIQAAFTASASADADPTALNWLYEAKIAGGASAMPGGLGQAVVILGPGHWIIWGDDPTAPTPLGEITVTGALPAAFPDLAAATVTITAVSNATGYDIAVEGDVQAGPQLVKFYNKTDQPHFVESLVSPVPVNDDQIMQLIMMPDDATPEPGSGLPAPEEIMPAGRWIPLVSAGVMSWNVMDFASGTNVLICFVQDRYSPDGLPHAAEGMFETVEVA